MYFKPSNTLRQKFINPKDTTSKYNIYNLVHAVQCREECKALYIGLTQTSFKGEWPNIGGPILEVKIPKSSYTVRKMDTFFEDSQVHILGSEDKWFAKSMKEATYV